MPKTKVTRQFIDATTGQLHLRVAGQASAKPAVVCLHLMPKSGRAFAEVLPELARDRLVVAPDYPGYGESDHWPEGMQPSIPDYADSMEEVIRHFGLERLDLVGHHTGAMVAVELAERHPQLVGKVINISAPILNAQEVQDFHNYYAAIPLDQEGTRFQTLWRRVQKFRGPGMTLEMAAASMAESLRGGERYEEGHRAAFNHSQAYAESLARIEQPVLVINVRDDLFEHSKRADRCLKNGTRVDYPDWGHGFLDIWPEEAAAAMLAFLDSDDAASEGAKPD